MQQLRVWRKAACR